MQHEEKRYYDPQVGRFLNSDDVNYIGTTESELSYNPFAYCENDPVNASDPTGTFGTPLQWAFAVIGGFAGWYFGDYVAKRLGYKSGWKYWTIRSGVIIGGAVLGWFVGKALVKVAVSFLRSHPSVLKKVPRAVMWMLGLSDNTQLRENLYKSCINHIYSKDHIRKGIGKLGASRKAVFNQIFRIVQTYLPKAVNGSNQIYTRINGYKVTIRFYINNGELKGINYFIGWAKDVVGKLLK